MNHKSLALGILILVFLITIIVFITASYTKIIDVNPIATLTAVSVAIVGVALFKKQLQNRV